MAIVLGNYTSYLNETFFLEQGKAYDTDDPISGPVIRALMKRYPDAFGTGVPPTPEPPPEVEQATAAPGEVRKRAAKKTN